MKNYLELISQEVKRRIPELTKSVFPARIDSEGRVLIPSQDNANEFVFAGIKDNDSNYFYIRHRDSGKIRFEEPTNIRRFTSFQHFVRVRYELRIVVVMKSVDPYKIEEKIRAAINGVNLPVCQGIFNPETDPIESIIDSIAVLKEESPKVKQFDKNLIFVSFDFDLLFDQDQGIIDFCDNPCET